MKIFTKGCPKIYGMLSLTTMLTMTTFKTMKLTQNPILVTGIARGWAEAFPDLADSVIIAGHRQDVLDHTTAADPGVARVSLDERSSACVSL